MRTTDCVTLLLDVLLERFYRESRTRRVWERPVLVKCERGGWVRLGIFFLFL